MAKGGATARVHKPALVRDQKKSWPPPTPIIRCTLCLPVTEANQETRELEREEEKRILLMQLAMKQKSGRANTCLVAQ